MYDEETFLLKLNSLHPSINFKIEIENQNSLPFLDVLVVRSPTNYPKFKVYRKPTHSNSYIHAFSNHSIDVKLGVISNIFLRAYKVCEMEYLDEEIKTIISSFKKLGYGMKIINKGLIKAKRKFYHNRNNISFNEDNKTFLILPQTFNNNKFMTNYLSKCGIKGVYKNTNTIKKVIGNQQSLAASKPCIYRIPCNNCNKSYIGETNDLERRKKQHIDSVRRGDINSALFQHMQENNHNINFGDTKLVANITETEKRKIVEAILIQNSNTFNIQQTNFNLDKLTSVLVNHHSKYIQKLLTKINDPP